MEVKYTTSTTGKWLFGTRTSYNTTDTFGLYFNSSSYWAQIASDKLGSKSGTIAKTPTGTHTIKMSETSFVHDGTTAVTYSTNLTTGKYPLYVGTINSGGGADGRCFNGQIYYFTIYSGDTAVMELVPVTNASGTAGMFDVVSGKFFASATSTALTAGGGANA